MEDQRKDQIDPKIPPKRNLPKQLQTNNVPTYDVENIIGTNKGRAADFSQKNKKNAAKDPETNENYSALISTSLTRARQNGKIYLWPGLTTKRHMIWFRIAG